MIRLHEARTRAVLTGGGLLALAVLAASGVAGAPAQAAFPGLNGRIACDGARGVASATIPAPANYSLSEIFSMKSDGTDLKLLTNNAGERDLDPAFSPDGRRLSFDRRLVGEGTSSEVYTMGADGSNQKRITFAAANDERTAWSPDGSEIAFMTGRDGNFNIYRTASNGSNPLGIGLTTHPGGDFSPAWSPDGSKIAFDSGGRLGDTNSEIYTMNAKLGDGSPGEVTKLTNTDPPIRNWSVNWAPDGKRIVYQSTRDGTNGTPTQGDDNFEIYTANPDGSGIQRLTNNADIVIDTPMINEAEDADPAFSPDGKKIVFESARSGDREVYTMDAADGGNVKRLTDNPGFDGRCDWQPVRPAVAPPVVAPKLVQPQPQPTVKSKTSLTLKAKPKRDRRLPFRYTFSGRVRIPAGVSKASVCGGRVRLTLKKGSKRVASGTAKVSKRCTYKRRITIRSTKRTGRKKGLLRVRARFGGNAFLKSSRKSTRVRFF